MVNTDILEKIGYNHLDELDNAYSLSFNPFSHELFAGYDRYLLFDHFSCIRIFQLNHPGRFCREVKTAKTRKDKDGLKGIISSIQFTSQNPKIYSVIS